MVNSKQLLASCREDVIPEASQGVPVIERMLYEQKKKTSKRVENLQPRSHKLYGNLTSLGYDVSRLEKRALNLIYLDFRQKLFVCPFLFYHSVRLNKSFCQTSIKLYK